MQIKRRSISLLLILAMMTVALVSLLPLTAAADPVGDNAADIQDFSYQTLSNANQTDETTDLRVMFTIGSLGYDAVGFVFSTSNSAPTAGGAGTYSTTTVHSTINAGGGNIPAGPGRFWVAVKLSDIPLASFETPIYVRPFIQVGENYSYIDAATITVCEALTYDKTVAGENAIFNSKSPSGEYYDEATGNYSVRKTFGNIRGDKQFFPTESDHDGNDLWFEYSLLWNQTLANTATARISAVDIVGYGPCEIYGLNTRNVAADEEFAGRFCFNRTYVYGSGEVDKKQGKTWFSSLNPPSDCVLELGNGQPRLLGRFDETVTADSFAPIGGYGWHRIGFRYHLETDPNDPGNAKALAEPGQRASYYAYTELYVDGVKVWKIWQSIVGYWDGDSWENRSFALRPNDALPFVLTASESVATTNSVFKGKATKYDGIWYVGKDNRSVGLCFAGVGNSENAVYIAVSDVHWTCGDGFVRNVSPVADPVDDHRIVLDDKGTADPSDDVTCSGKIWYVFDN